MVLKLYGHIHATCTHRVATVLHEKKVPFEFIEVDVTKGEQKFPEHLKRQPFGQIPVIDDDGFMLYESRAICRYICEKYPDQGPVLIPTDIKAKAIFEQAASVELSHFDPYASKAIAEMIYKPALKQIPIQAIFDEQISLLAKGLAVYDTILGSQKYVAGNDITLVDIFHIPFATLLAPAGSDIVNSFPNVSRWLEDISSRHSWVVHQSGVVSVNSYPSSPTN